jgi:6-phospho-3-hexuloisomerase
MADEGQTTFQDDAERAIGELRGALRRVSPGTADRMARETLAARRIVGAGAGREGLMIRAFCMRLMHLGLDAHVAGDMATPAIGPGDLLIASVGPGHLATVEALLRRARQAQARTLVVTAVPGGPAAALADVAIVLPGQTMADDLAAKASLLPMGTLFEWLALVFFDLVALDLRARTGQTAEQVRARHTNVE